MASVSMFFASPDATMLLAASPGRSLFGRIAAVESVDIVFSVVDGLQPFRQNIAIQNKTVKGKEIICLSVFVRGVVRMEVVF